MKSAKKPILYLIAIITLSIWPIERVTSIKFGGINSIQFYFKGSEETCRIGIKFSDPYFHKLKAKCLNCDRKNGFLECFTKNCSSIDGCYKLQKDECCVKCQGCTTDKFHRDSGTEWDELTSPGVRSTCVAGIVTRSLVGCYTPCKNPTPKTTNQQCPSCPECSYKNKTIEGETFIMPETDPCVSCSCNHGSLQCNKKTCPVIDCPEGKIIKKQNECCPQCQGSGNNFQPHSSNCIFRSKIYSLGMHFYPDNCSNCTCVNSTIVCEKKNCPILLCELKDHIYTTEECCPTCRNSTESISNNHRKMKKLNTVDRENEDMNKRYSERSCKYDGMIYKNNKIWKPSICEICTCNNGRVNCSLIKCKPMTCSQDSYLKVLPGECCPVCIESHGVCAVHRGSEFRTFDGLYYDFVGSCKYLLVSDCLTKKFSVILKNIVAENNAFIKKITLLLWNIKIDLQENKKIKVDEKIVDLPYQLENVVLINKTNEMISVNTKIGVQIKWNYKSVLHIKVPNNFRNKLCGLCGNFNSIPDDDMTTKQNVTVNDPTIFAQSWAFDDDRECLKVKRRAIAINYKFYQ